jgi:hypothetical protein
MPFFSPTAPVSCCPELVVVKIYFYYYHMNNTVDFTNFTSAKTRTIYVSAYKNNISSYSYTISQSDLRPST